jgi:hypothetical protein
MRIWAAILMAAAMAAAQETPSGSTPADAPPVDSLPVDSLPAFKQDSTKSETIKSIEAGGGSAPKAQVSPDSLDAKRRARRPFLGLSLALSFSDFSAKGRFSARLDTVSRRDSLRILQKYDPVHFSFPVGLTLGIPVLPYADIWLRSEHFWYRVSALAQGDGPAQEFFYAVQAHLLGVGARYLLPVSLMSVTGRPGIFFRHGTQCGSCRSCAPQASPARRRRRRSRGAALPRAAPLRGRPGEARRCWRPAWDRSPTRRRT